MRKHFGSKILAGLTAATLAVSSLLGFTPVAAANSSAANASPGAALHLSAAPVTAVLSSSADVLELRATLHNTGKSGSNAGVISFFVDPQPHVSRETLQHDFPATALLIAQQSVPELQANEKFTASSSLQLTELSQLLQRLSGGDNTSQTLDSGTATTAAHLKNGAYRIQALYTPNAQHSTAQHSSVKTPSGKTNSASPNSAPTEHTADSNSASNATQDKVAEQKKDTSGDTNNNSAAIPNSNFIPLLPLPTWQLKKDLPTSADLRPASPSGDTLATNAAAGAPFAAASSFVYTGGGDPLPQNKIHLVLPLTLPEHIETIPTPQQLQELLAPETPLQELLQLAQRTQATVAIDPRLIIAIRLAADTAAPHVTEFLKQLENPKISSFLLPYADADLATQALLQQQPLEPSGVSFALPAAAAQDLAAAGATDIAALSKLRTTAPATAWFNPGTASTNTIGAAQAIAAKQLIVDSADLTEHNGQSRISLPAHNLDALVAPHELSVALTQIATHAPDEITAQAATAALYTQLLHTPEAILLADRGGAVANLRTARLLQAVNTTDFLTAVPSEQLSSGSGELQEKPSEAALKAFAQHEPVLSAAIQREHIVQRYAPALAQPQQLLDYQRSRLIQLFNAARLGNSAAQLQQFHRAAQQFGTDDTALLNGIQLLAPAHTHIIGKEAKLPLQIRNTLPFDIAVMVELESGSPAISVTTTQLPDLQISAGETLTVFAPLSSQTASGKASVIAHLLSDDGSQNLSTETFSLSVNQYFEWFGLGMLVLALALLLGAGLWRTAKKRGT